MPLGTEVGLGSGHTVLDRDPAAPTEMGTAAPSLFGLSIVAKRSPISATAELVIVMVSACANSVLAHFHAAANNNNRFNSPLSSSTQVSLYQKKHSLTHTLSLSLLHAAGKFYEI